MNNYKNSIVLFLKRFFLIAVIYQFSRILFYLINLKLFETITFQNVTGGLLFDLAAIAYINIIFLIAHLIPGDFKYKPRYQNILKITFYSVNLLFIATNFIDIIYYRFTGRRSTFSMITAKGMEQEALGLIPSFLKEFWYIFVLFLIVSILLWKLIPNLRTHLIHEKTTRKDYYKQFAYFILSLVIILLLGRGGIRKKPIKIVDAAEYGALNNSGLVLNTPFCILKTVFKKEDIDKANYYNEKDDKLWQEYIEKNPEDFMELPYKKKDDIWKHLDELRRK